MVLGTCDLGLKMLDLKMIVPRRPQNLPESDRSRFYMSPTSMEIHELRDMKSRKGTTVS